MFPALSRRARLTAAAIAMLALASVAGMFVYLNTLRAEAYADTAWDMARFFTIWTNILVGLTWGVAALRRDGMYPPWLAALTLSVIMVGAVYHALLSHLVTFTGIGFYADHGLHTIVPMACALWWLIYAPKRALSYGDLPIFALWPAIYVAYALARGAREALYPYPFMDLMELSPAAVATNLGCLMILLLLGGVLFVSIGRYADR